MTIDLTDRESQLLQLLLSRYIQDSKSEIYRTDTPAFKDELREEQSTAKTLLGKIAGAAAA